MQLRRDFVRPSGGEVSEGSRGKAKPADTFLVTGEKLGHSFFKFYRTLGGTVGPVVAGESRRWIAPDFQ